MDFIRSSRKRTEKVSSDSSVISSDLLANLTYMSAVSVGSVSRDVIFQLAMAQGYKTSGFFRQVYLLTKQLGFEYARSFQLVSQRANADIIKILLLRFAGSLTTGQTEFEFLRQEARVERDPYINLYQRSVQTLQKWADAYAAILVSVTLIVVVALISTMIYDFGSYFVMIVAMTMGLMSFVGTWVIYKSVPYEIKTFTRGHNTRERRKATFLFMLLGPLGFLFLAFSLASMGLGLGFLVLGICLLPAGIYSFMDDVKVTAIDDEIDRFFRSLGAVAESLGTTVSGGLYKLDRRSLVALEPYIRRLQARLQSNIRPDVCWDRFKEETGSELVNRSTSMFLNGTSVGGGPSKVGDIAADYAMNVALLRRQRGVASLLFAYLTIPLQGAMTALLVFVLEIMTSFNNKISLATSDIVDSGGAAAAQIPNLPVFQPKDMGTTTLITLATIVTLTLANTLSSHFATGGHPLKLAFYGGIMCTLTELNLVLIPPVATLILA